MTEKYFLLVEDNPDDELLTIRAFKSEHIANKIIVVHDGAEALDFLFSRGAYEKREPRNLPVIVLLDLKLPKLNGFEVLKELRSNEVTKYLPVVVLTSSKEDKDIVEGYRLGANSYVQKPVDYASFLESARQLHLYWLLLNEPLPDRS